MLRAIRSDQYRAPKTGDIMKYHSHELLSELVVMIAIYCASQIKLFACFSYHYGRCELGMKGDELKITCFVKIQNNLISTVCIFARSLQSYQV